MTGDDAKSDNRLNDEELLILKTAIEKGVSELDQKRKNELAEHIIEYTNRLSSMCVVTGGASQDVRDKAAEYIRRIGALYCSLALDCVNAMQNVILRGASSDLFLLYDAVLDDLAGVVKRTGKFNSKFSVFGERKFYGSDSEKHG